MILFNERAELWMRWLDLQIWPREEFLISMFISWVKGLNGWKRSSTGWLPTLKLPDSLHSLQPPLPDHVCVLKLTESKKMLIWHWTWIDNGKRIFFKVYNISRLVFPVVQVWVMDNLNDRFVQNNMRSSEIFINNQYNGDWGSCNIVCCWALRILPYTQSYIWGRA